MKVVLFCGGQGMRMREYSETIPKPMVRIGYRPILWHVMRYYAHFGHTEFILCLGHGGDVIKNYFLSYNEAVSNDFVLEGNGENNNKITLLSTDIHNWKITFADTGYSSNIGQRLYAVQKYLKDDKKFLASYADGLIDMQLDDSIRFANEQDKIATFVSVRPSQSFHLVQVGKNGAVSDLKHVTEAGVWINGGYFVLKHEIFDYMNEGEELVYEPFQRLIKLNQLVTYKYDGFFVSIDTFKEKQYADDMYASGNTPWEVWKNTIK
jgi:glucose-1-phosphate cytidylyltransferase